MYELCYTSAPRGIRPGSSGYTTVAHTRELPPALLQRLESLSTFDHVEKNAAAYAKNPINHAHLTFGSGQQRLHVVSRIAACEPDHSGRTNYLAHHVVVSEAESRGLPAGPAAFAADSSLFRGNWSGEPQLLSPRHLPSVVERGHADGQGWRDAGFDPGWVRYAADLVQRRGKPLYIVYPTGMDALALLADIVAAVPDSQRWGVTFATHATTGFPGLGVDCLVRFVFAGTPYAAEVLARSRPEHCIDLTKPRAAPAIVRQHVAESATPQRSAGQPSDTARGGGKLGNEPWDLPRRGSAEDLHSMPRAPAGARRSTGVSAPSLMSRAAAAWALGAVLSLAVIAAGATVWVRSWRSTEKELAARSADRGEIQGNKTRQPPTTTSNTLTQEAPQGPAGSSPENIDSEAPPTATLGGDPPGDAGPPEAEPTSALGQDETAMSKPGPVIATDQSAPTARKKSFSFADIAGVREKAGRARQFGWSATLVSGLGQDDEVEVTLGSEADVVGYEVSSKNKKKWELKEKDGPRRTLATFKREKDMLILGVEANGELVRFLTCIVTVDAKTAPKETHEFAIGVPIKNRLGLTPAETPSGSDDPLIQACGNDFHLFRDRKTYEWLNRILVANPELRLKVTFDEMRLTGGVEVVDSIPSLVVKRLKGKSGTTYSPDEWRLCGFVLAMPEAKTGTFRLINYWIQNPSTRISPSSTQGIRLPIPPDEKQAVADLVSEVDKAENDVEKAHAAAQNPELKKEQKADAEAAHQEAIARRAAAVEALSNGRTNYENSKSIVTKMPLSDFQEVPVRISLCRPGVEAEIVIVDSLKQ
jgi:hypothetical protein